MIHVGCDVHKKMTHVAVWSGRVAGVGEPYRVPTATLADHLVGIEDPKRVVMETSNAGVFAARQVKGRGIDVLLVDAFKASRLMDTVSRNKTDKLDARALALLLAGGCLDHAAVWVAPPEVHQLREIARARYSMVCDGVRLRNQVRKLLGRNGLDCPHSDLLGHRAGHFLDDATAQLPSGIAVVLVTLRQALHDTQARVEQLTETLHDQAKEHEAVGRLMTIPGFGQVLSATAFAEIGDISRFDTVRDLCSYSNLTPRIRHSSDRCHTGPLTKHGNRLLAWSLIQGAAHFASCKRNQDLSMLKSYRRVVYTHGPNPAKVSLARHLVRIIFAMLRDGTSFVPERLPAAPAR